MRKNIISNLVAFAVAILPLSLVVADRLSVKLPWSPSGTVMVRPESCDGVSVSVPPESVP